MPIMARTSGGIYTAVSDIYDTQGNAISKVYDTQGNVVFKKNNIINGLLFKISDTSRKNSFYYEQTITKDSTVTLDDVYVVAPFSTPEGNLLVARDLQGRHLKGKIKLNISGYTATSTGAHARYDIWIGFIAATKKTTETLSWLPMSSKYTNHVELETNYNTAELIIDIDLALYENDYPNRYLGIELMYKGGKYKNTSTTTNRTLKRQVTIVGDLYIE